MYIDQKMMDLICELEYIVGQECFNPHSLNGYTGEEGKDFRYPVYAAMKMFSDEHPLNNEPQKVYGRLTNVLPKNISTIKYKFGANHLYVGIAMKKVLEYLSSTYDIDFNNLNNK